MLFKQAGVRLVVDSQSYFLEFNSTTTKTIMRQSQISLGWLYESSQIMLLHINLSRANYIYYKINSSKLK